jgi:hypothetical protein
MSLEPGNSHAVETPKRRDYELGQTNHISGKNHVVAELFPCEAPCDYHFR